MKKLLSAIILGWMFPNFVIVSCVVTLKMFRNYRRDILSHPDNKDLSSSEASLIAAHAITSNMTLFKYNLKTHFDKAGFFKHLVSACFWFTIYNLIFR